MTEVWMTALQLLTPLFLGIISWFLRRTLQQFDERANRHEDRLRRLEEDKVSREDWIRESNILRQRQECMIEKLTEIKAQADIGMQIAAAIRSLRAGKGDNHE